MATMTLAVSTLRHESTRTGQSVSPATPEDDVPTYPVDVQPEAPADFSSINDPKVVQRLGLQQGGAAVSSDTVTSSDYVLTLERIDELRQEEREDDRPSDHGYFAVKKVLAEAARELSLRFPRASVSVGPYRGLRVTWSFGTAEVRLIIGGSAANRSYIYWELGTHHGVVHSVDGRHLAHHLRRAQRLT